MYAALPSIATVPVGAVPSVGAQLPVVQLTLIGSVRVIVSLLALRPTAW